MPVQAGTIVVQLLNGISIGLSFALIAAGLTLIFGVMDIVNFAHGEFYMIGAYATLVVLPYVGIFWVGVAIAALISAAIAIIIERVTLKPLRGRDPLQSLIVTFGFVLILQQAALEIFGGSPKDMPTPITGTVKFFGITYPWIRIATIVGGLIIIAALFLFLRRTRLGIMMRASAEDLDTARALGVPSDRIFSLSMGISALLAALAAPFLGVIRGVNPTMGSGVIVTAFIVVIVGGLGSVQGAVVAALLIGLIESMTVLFIPPWASQILALGVLILVLLVKPEGLFGG
ncbi:MAG: branched-chain amino acid ABC transporter permease [Salinirussus sp.]